MGTADLLFPPGVTDIQELPGVLFDTIRMSMVINSWDELPEDERPPKAIWLNDEKLKNHFEWLKQKRKSEMDPDNQIEDAVENPAAKDLIIGR